MGDETTLLRVVIREGAACRHHPHRLPLVFVKQCALRAGLPQVVRQLCVEPQMRASGGLYHRDAGPVVETPEAVVRIAEHLLDRGDGVGGVLYADKTLAAVAYII